VPATQLVHELSAANAGALPHVSNGQLVQPAASVVAPADEPYLPATQSVHPDAEDKPSVALQRPEGQFCAGVEPTQNEPAGHCKQVLLDVARTAAL